MADGSPEDSASQERTILSEEWNSLQARVAEVERLQLQLNSSSSSSSATCRPGYSHNFLPTSGKAAPLKERDAPKAPKARVLSLVMRLQKENAELRRENEELKASLAAACEMLEAASDSEGLAYEVHSRHPREEKAKKDKKKEKKDKKSKKDKKAKKDKKEKKDKKDKKGKKGKKDKKDKKGKKGKKRESSSSSEDSDDSEASPAADRDLLEAAPDA